MNVQLTKSEKVQAHNSNKPNIKGSLYKKPNKQLSTQIPSTRLHQPEDFSTMALQQTEIGEDAWEVKENSIIEASMDAKKDRTTDKMP